MNKYQRLVVIVALIDVLIMLIFPPFDSRSLTRGLPGSFDGYQLVFSAFGDKPVNGALLAIQLMFVGANALAAWLVLQTKVHHEDIPTFRYLEGIGIFVAIDLAVILLFPPFEPYSSLQKGTTSTFDSFYFIFGDRSRRPLYLPLLQLEAMWVFINALALWLLFNAVKRNDDAARAKILSLAESLPDDQLELISAEIRHRIDEHHSHAATAIGRGPERRHGDPDYHGTERRDGHDRRH